MNATQSTLESLKTYRDLLALQLNRASDNLYTSQWGVDRRRELDATMAQIARIQYQQQVNPNA